MTQDLDRILDHVDQLQALDTDGIEPTAHAIPLATPLREDEAQPGIDPHLALANAPLSEANAFVVPKVIDGEEFADKTLHRRVRRLYRLARIAVFRVFYSNFPDHKILRNTRGVPVVKPGDLHQITVPDTPDLTTGWDIAGYRGPLSWEQEEQGRAEMSRIHWHDDLEDLVVRYRPKP